MKTVEEIMIPQIPGVKIKPSDLRALLTTLDGLRKALPPSMKITDEDVADAIWKVSPPPRHGGRKEVQRRALYANAMRHRMYALSWAFRDPRMRRYGEISAKAIDIDDAVIAGACKARLVIREFFGWFDIKDLVRCIEREKANVEAAE